MSDQTINEIIKSHIYGYSVNEIADIYAIFPNDVEKIIEKNAKKISEFRKYFSNIGG